MTERLHPDDLEALKQHQAELVRQQTTQLQAHLDEMLRGDAQTADVGMVDVKTVARELGVGTDYVYRHKRELGGVPLGKGPSPRWRFDLDRARGAYIDLQKPPDPEAKPTRPRRQVRKAATTSSGAPLLDYAGRDGKK